MSPRTKNDDRSSLPPKSSVLNVNQYIFLFYALLGNAFIPRLVPSTNISIVLSTLWLGFVLAISGMEAWLKFRAPFCPRPFALDIGRTIFPALNSVELALCLSLWARLLRQTTNVLSHSSLLLVTAVLFMDIFVLTPKLVLRGKQVVYQHVKTHNGVGGAKNEVDTTSPAFLSLEAELQGHTFRKTDKWHIVYVFIELVKIIGLTFVIKQL